jgi:hypothetical protein
MQYITMTLKRLFLALLVLAALAGFFYWRYSYFRTPMVVDNTEPSSEVLMEDLVDAGVVQDGIPSIDEAKYESIVEADMYLDDLGSGLAVESSGRAWFFPYQVLVWHEIANTSIDGVPMVVTYCPLCASGIVYRAQVEGQTLEFGTTGKLWNNNLVMYDRQTDSWWVQLLGKAFNGVLEGKGLESYPSIEMTWDEFKGSYRSANVLSRETAYDRDYTSNPYGSYEDSMAIYYPLTHMDERLYSKDRVLGLIVGEEVIAYPEKFIKEEGEISGSLAGESFTISLDEDTISVESSSERLRSVQSYWFCFVASYPSTSIYLGM